jgi:hypothetical protein
MKYLLNHAVKSEVFTKWIFFLIIAIAIIAFAKSIDAQQGRRPAPIPESSIKASLENKRLAEDIADQFWAARLVECKPKVFYTTMFSYKGVVEILELQKKSITLTSDQKIFSPEEQASGLQWNSMMLLSASQTSPRNPSEYYKVNLWHSLRIVKGAPFIENQYDPIDFVRRDPYDREYLPLKCRDILSYVDNGKFTIEEKAFINLFIQAPELESKWITLPSKITAAKENARREKEIEEGKKNAGIFVPTLTEESVRTFYLPAYLNNNCEKGTWFIIVQKNTGISELVEIVDPSWFLKQDTTSKNRYTISIKGKKHKIHGRQNDYDSTPNAVIEITAEMFPNKSPDFWVTRLLSNSESLLLEEYPTCQAIKKLMTR